MAFPSVGRGIGAKARTAEILSQTTRRFLGDKRGNFALLTVISIVPILGGLALGVDYAEMSRQRQVTLNALDASGVATARRIIEGVTDDEAKAYAKSFFEANLGSVAPSMTTLTVLLPQNNTGGGTLKLTAGLKYKPYFFQAFAALMGNSSGATNVNFQATSEIRLKNTLEVALVLDNSGSMDFIGGGGSGKKRMELLKDRCQAVGRHHRWSGRADEADQQASAVRPGSVLGLGEYRLRQGNGKLDGPGRALADPS